MATFHNEIEDRGEIAPLVRESPVVPGATTRNARTQFLAAHLVTLRPGERSSRPHAESDEEEFFYVVKGRPTLWRNGEVYALEAGHAVGFPAGDGVCHTALNDSSEDVQLLVIGEKTKPENRYLYPLEPDLARDPEHAKSWWHTSPIQAMGDHPGTCGSGRHARSALEAPGVVHGPSLHRFPPFSYRGDTEQFTRGHRLSNPLKLKAIGVWHEFMDPAHRTSWPHAHEREEEYAFILRGHPQAWINGRRFPLAPGDLVYFEPGTNLAHVLENTTDETVEFLGFGMGDAILPDDKLYYPLHPGRNEQCRARSALWEIGRPK